MDLCLKMQKINETPRQVTIYENKNVSINQRGQNESGIIIINILKDVMLNFNKYTGQKI